MFNGFNFPQMPFQFPLPFQMGGAEQNTGAQPNGFPFSFPFAGMNLPQMPFQFPLPFQTPGTEQSAETKDAAAQPNGFPFPFPFAGMNLPQMPFQFPFPFQIPGANQNAGAQPNAFNPFAFLTPEFLLQKVLQLDASPQTLERLQKIIDFIYDWIAKQQEA